MAGLTQEELAARTGLSVRAIGDLERGRTARPHSRSVKVLAQALGLAEPAYEQLVDLQRQQLAAGAAEPAGLPHQLVSRWPKPRAVPVGQRLVAPGRCLLSFRRISLISPGVLSRWRVWSRWWLRGCGLVSRVR